jgi:hypothetical protein
MTCLDSFVRASNLKWSRRLAAGWDCDPEYGWVAPCGTTESDWEDNGYPLPEDDDFASWFSAFYHYEALENDSTPNPFPNAKP